MRPAIFWEEFYLGSGSLPSPLRLFVPPEMGSGPYGGKACANTFLLVDSRVRIARAQALRYDSPLAYTYPSVTWTCRESLPPEILKPRRRQLGISDWEGSMGIFGSIFGSRVRNKSPASAENTVLAQLPEVEAILGRCIADFRN